MAMKTGIEDKKNTLANDASTKENVNVQISCVQDNTNAVEIQGAEYRTILLHAEKFHNGQRDFADVLKKDLRDLLSVDKADELIIILEKNNPNFLDRVRVFLSQFPFTIVEENGTRYQLVRRSDNFCELEIVPTIETTAPAQILQNLPQELLVQPRFFPVKIIPDEKGNLQKVPCITGWQKQKNQMTAYEAAFTHERATGLIGMDICGHGVYPDFFFVDFDHVKDQSGNFLYDDAERWDNYLQIAETFSERSFSKNGTHYLFCPTPNKFPTLTGENAGHAIYFDETKKGKHSPKIELFHCQGRYILLTGDCQPNLKIVSGEVADEFCQQLCNQVSFDTSQIKDTADNTINLADISIEEVNKMLAVISCVKAAYADWWKIGAILHYHFGANGFEIWRAWSETDKARYTLEECQKVWSTLDKRAALNISRPATIGSLIRFAKKFGYIPPKKNVRPVAMDDQLTDDEPRARDFIPDCPINARIPFNFELSNGGIRFITPPKKETDEPKVTQVTRTPLVVTKVFTETKNFETQYEIAMKIDKAWRFITVDGRTLQDPRRVLDLAGTGALIEAPPILAKYFIRFIAINREAITKTKVYSQPGWHDDQFIYPTGGEDYICSRSNIDYKKLFATKGDPEKWKQKFCEVTNRSKTHRIFVGAAAASTFLETIGEPNFWLHINGGKNSGKTPLLKFALSIFGDPNQLMRSFDSSAKNMVTMAAGLNDFPQGIDELESLGKKGMEELQKSIYDLQMGKDKQKNTRSGDVKKTENFRIVRLSTGEQPLHRPTDKGGAHKRAIDLHVSTPLFIVTDARDLHLFCARNYGHFGRIWTEYNSKHKSEILADFDAITKQLFDKYGTEMEPAHITAVAACAVAFWHFRKCIGLEEKFDAYHALADASLILNELPTQEEISDTNRGIDLLASWTNEHPKNFATYGDKTGTLISATSFTETSGIQFPDGRVAFFPNAFRHICEDELHLPSYEKFLNELFDEGKLICPSRRDKRKSIKVGDEVKKLYMFKAGTLITLASDDTDEISYGN